MSIHPLSSIDEYWSSKGFSGVQDFKDVMSREQFQLV